ncbi:hypothetical protein B0H19DRAFT_187804 [Mycena capillaripes]|nr:hypothetical protein B0H19DRAFT_187804 [Mycena capillaripes]
MTRGRKKDVNIPPTRTLTLQRDYRARKTQYVADLEARCKAAEEENARLRQELAFLRQQGRSPAALSPAAASALLRDNLSAAASSLSHFIQVALALPGGDGLEPTTPTSYDAAMEPLTSPATAQAPTFDESLVSSLNCRGPVRPVSPCCGGTSSARGSSRTRTTRRVTRARV